MIIFRDKNDIIRWLEKHCPRKAIVRSLNNAELLGGFDPIPPNTRPGWIVRVTSVHKRKWIVAIIPCVGKPDCEIRILKYVPWGNYIGGPFTNPVYSGDNPLFYKMLQERVEK